MKNSSISDFVATKMDEILKSKEHQDLFATQYKRAAAACTKCGKDSESCMCDSAMADDQDARKKKKEESDSASADDQDARKKKKEESSDSSSADDADSASVDDSEDSASADDEDSSMQSSAAFDVAIDSLLTASAALDSLGLDRGSVFTLKIASLVVNAKKKDDKKKKDKKKNPFAKGTGSDSQSAKDKAVKAKEKEKADKEKAKVKAEKEKAKEKADKEKEKEKAAKEKAKAAKEKASKK